MKLLVDQNLSRKWVPWLTANGVIAVHWSTVGESDAPDTQIMFYAKENGYIVLTRDLDFGQMLVDQQLRLPSIIQLRGAHVVPENMGETLLGSLRQSEPGLTSGAILTSPLSALN